MPGIEVDQTENARLIQLKRSAGDPLDVPERIWGEKLSAVEPDPTAGIRHAEVSGSPNYRKHVAAIDERVNCHYHSLGQEDYAVAEGSGVLWFGEVTQGPDGPEVDHDGWRSIEVSAGDTFVIPEGYAHQLIGKITLLFGCPDSHLNDDEDRFPLPDSPGVEKI